MGAHATAAALSRRLSRAQRRGDTKRAEKLSKKLLQRQKEERKQMKKEKRKNADRASGRPHKARRTGGYADDEHVDRAAVNVGKESNSINGGTVRTSEKVCRFFLRGQCTRGADCSFAHPEGMENSFVADEQTLRDEELRRQREEKNTSLILFYQYVENPAWTPEERELAMQFAYDAGTRHGITGRLRTAFEGFNGTLTGPYDGVRKFCQELREFVQLDGRRPCADTDFKLTDNLPNGQAFTQLNVFPVVELVNYGLAGDNTPALVADGVGTAKHLSAEEYHKQMEKPNTVIIDVRNSYEVEVGRFNPPPGGAEFIDPGWRKSTEFPEWIVAPETVKKLEGKNVMMYCTGGIRCERASAHVRKVLGDKIQGLYQLQGGIERYLKEYADDGGHWIGKNYTFDKRFVHGPANKPNHELEVISKCTNDACQAPCDRYRNKKKCAYCRVPILLCRDCQNAKVDKKRPMLCRLCKEEGRTGKVRKFPPPQQQQQQHGSRYDERQMNEMYFDYGGEGAQDF